MIPLRADELVKVVKGRLLRGQEKSLVKSINLNSKTLKRGDFFIPLKGERFDAHQFLEQALSRGTSGFLVEKPSGQMASHLKGLKKETVIIEVANTLRALQDIAGYLRHKLDLEVVGITGSTGKTCTKDTLASILSLEKKIIASEKNYNNEIGVPLTILRATKATEVLVVEMAMRHLGEIKDLARIVKPTIGLVTNIGVAHFELLGSEGKIFQAKSDLVKALPSAAPVVLNADCKWTKKLIDLAKGKVVTFGLKKKADVTASDVKLDKLGQPSFEVVSKRGRVRVKLPLPGRYNIYNALAAATVAIEMGFSLSNIKKGLEKVHLSEMRMKVLPFRRGITILNDAYNANPTSMQAALFTLAEIAAKRRIAVLGDMLELGKVADVSHRELGRLVPRVKVDVLVTVGEKGKLIAKEARKKMSDSNVFAYLSVEEAAGVLKNNLRKGDVVLVKASRKIALERIIDLIKD